MKTNSELKSSHTSVTSQNSATKSMIDLNDAKLIEACLDGNEYAWETLIERYSRLIYTIPLRFGFPQTIADEVFQETCVILLEKLNTLRDRDRLSSWLVTVSRRACIQRWRQPKEPQTVDLLDANELAEDQIEDEMLRIEQQHLVHKAINGLGPRCQWILKALFFEIPPLSYDDIAEQLDIPIGSVGPTRARCLGKLRESIMNLE